jgi:hypothetical protein
MRRSVARQWGRRGERSGVNPARYVEGGAGAVRLSGVPDGALAKDLALNVAVVLVLLWSQVGKQ